MYITIDEVNRKISLQTDSDAHIKWLDAAAYTLDPIRVGLVIKLANYLDVTDTVWFNVNIKPCLITSFDFDSTHVPQTHYIFDAASAVLPWITYTQTPDCGYAVDYSIYESSWANLTYPDFLKEASDLSGVYFETINYIYDNNFDNPGEGKEYSFT